MIVVVKELMFYSKDSYHAAKPFSRLFSEKMTSELKIIYRKSLRQFLDRKKAPVAFFVGSKVTFHNDCTGKAFRQSLRY